MPTVAKDSPTSFEQAPTGMIQAVCAFVNDIGNQLQNFAGEEKILHKVVVTWELIEKQSKGEPFLMSKFYTLSLNDKATLRKDLEAWRGKAFSEQEISDGFDIEKLIGANCYLNITTNDKGKSVVSSVNPLPKGLEKISVSSIAMPENFSKWIQSMREKAVEIAQHPVSASEPVNYDRDLPF